MPKVYAFYNPSAGNGQCKNDVHFLDLMCDDQIIYCDLTKSETYEKLLFAITKEDVLVLCGGDGTLNRFLNLVHAQTIPCDILYFPLGCSNQFARSLGQHFGCAPFSVRRQLCQLPKITVNGRQISFLSQIRYRCLHKNRPVALSLSSDGVHSHFKKVWHSVIEKDFTANQLVVQISEGFCRLQSKWKPCTVLSGRNMTFTFSKPITVYLDGDPVSNVTAYTVTL